MRPSPPLAKGRLCYSVNGFSLHWNTAVNTHSRDGLRKLVEYMARGSLSNQRLELLPDRKVKLNLKTLWHDGTSHLLLTPSEFLEKLAAIVPPPRAHLVKWGGVFVPNSPLRRKVILKPGVKKAARHKQCAEIEAGEGGKDEEAAGDKKDSTLQGPSWARLLSRAPPRCESVMLEFDTADPAVVRYRQNAGWTRKTQGRWGVVEILGGFRGQNSRS